MDSANATKLVSLPSSGTGRNTLFCDGPLLALTISQPYASLIADGQKWVENRFWASHHYRGPIAIHAGRGTQYLTPAALRGYTIGKIIAVADLVACVHVKAVRRYGHTYLHLDKAHRRILDTIGISVDDFLNHEHTEGPWCWILRNVRKLSVPVEARGKQGLWLWHMSDALELEPVAAEAVR